MTTQTTTHTAYGTPVTVLATELNALANNADSGVSGGGTGVLFDNTAGLYLFADLELVLAVQGSARSAGARITVQMSVAAGGTTYTDVSSSFEDPIATYYLDNVVTARRRLAWDIPLRPAKMKFYVTNLTGQAFAASGTSLILYPHTVQSA